MEMPKFCVITVAECDANYLSRALELTRELKNEIEEKGNPVSIRAGTLITGYYAGAMAFFQNYLTLSDFEQSYEILQASWHYQSLFKSGAAKVASRNLIKFSPVEYEENLIVEAQYLVLTRVKTLGSMLPSINRLAPVFSKTGALSYRLGSIMTGNNVGNELLGVSYKSMNQIETAYDLLVDNLDYKDLLKNVTVKARNIVKLASG
ncbi:MAG: hypothetical protein CMM27_04960 [Rhodospirillaceae bacterium]|nr:hypothetical protein [Rhodospirillaceae bacterium]|tara:strand:+ start:427 stop:1044 length:618 start_codon:yes stop_codon:yes gene_type:complete